MKTPVLFLWLVLSSAFTMAQTVSHSDLYDEVDGPKYYFTEAGGTLAIKITGRTVITQKIDHESLTTLPSARFPTPTREWPFWAGKINERYYVLYYELHGKLGIIAREVIYSTGKVDPNAVYLIKEKEQVKSDVNVSITHAKQGQKFMIRYKLKSQKNFERYKLCLFDGNLTLLSQNIIRIPFAGKDISIDHEMLDSKGNLYMSTTRLDGDYSKDYKTPYVKYQKDLLKVSPGNPAPQVITPPLVKYRFAQLHAFENNDGTIGCAAVINVREYTIAAGMKLYFFDKNGEVTGETSLRKGFTEFDYFPEENGIAMKLGYGASASDFAIDDVLCGRGGAITIVGQRRHAYRIWVPSGAGQGGPTLTQTTFMGDVVLFNLEKDGNEQWVSNVKIPGHNYSAKKPSPSYVLFPAAGRYYVFFNDTKEGQQAGISYVSLSDGVLGLIKVDEEGETERSTLLDFKDYDGMHLHLYEPSQMFRPSAKEFLFEAYVKKSKQNVMVKIKM